MGSKIVILIHRLSSISLCYTDIEAGLSILSLSDAGPSELVNFILLV